MVTQHIYYGKIRKTQMFYRVQRACDQVSETSRKQLREEMTLEFDTERSALIAKYEKERNSLRSVLFEKKKLGSVL